LNLVNFFITYFLFLLASSVTITAFFCVTRGGVEVMPDGSERRYGKILKGYYFFWFKEKGKIKTGYKDDELANAVHQMQEYYAEPITLAGDPFKSGGIAKFETSEGFLAVIPLIRHKLQMKFTIEEQYNGKVVVAAYAEEPDYVFPEWLRTVMAGCITCTPTVYGNIIFWGAVLFFKESVLYNSLFCYFSNEYAGIVVVWLAYWVSLAWLNTVLWNIYDK